MKNEFQTPDMYLYAYLLSLEYKTLRITRDKRRCTFVVEAKASLRSDIQKYHNNEAVPVGSYVSAIMSVRSKIRDFARSDWKDYADFKDVRDV